MKIMAFFSLLAILMAAPSHAGEMIVVGRAMSQKAIENVSSPCPENAICLNSWWRWELNIECASGETPISGRILAANHQHGQVTEAHLSRLKTFIIIPIESAEKRQMLGADYFLSDKSVEQKMACARHSSGN